MWPFPIINGVRTPESEAIIGKPIKKTKETFDDIPEALI